jgi:hypothetical protein
MNGDMCFKCVHFVDLSEGDTSPGICRRFPPIVVPKGPEQFFTTFPRVNRDMLCGEYHEKDRIIQ